MTKLADQTLNATAIGTAFKAKLGALAGTLYLRGDAAGTVAIERSPDDGANWYPVPASNAFDALQISKVANVNVSVDLYDAVPGVQWRINYTRTAGVLIWEFHG